MKFHLLSDPELKLHRAFDVLTIKKAYGRETEGVLRSTFILNEKGEILWSKRKVQPRGHAEEVLKALKDITER